MKYWYQQDPKNDLCLQTIVFAKINKPELAEETDSLNELPVTITVNKLRNCKGCKARYKPAGVYQDSETWDKAVDALVKELNKQPLSWKEVEFDGRYVFCEACRTYLPYVKVDRDVQIVGRVGDTGFPEGDMEPGMITELDNMYVVTCPNCGEELEYDCDGKRVTYLLKEHDQRKISDTGGSGENPQPQQEV